MNNPKISIIVPVYNTEEYMDKCIESIIHQSYENIELILINDGSTDGSLNICLRHANRDSRILVIDIPHRGASHARNVGLDRSSGDLIWFVDSDDWIEKDTLEKLIPEMKDDILFFGYKKVINNYTERCQVTEKSVFHISEIDYCLSKLFVSKNLYFGFTWNKFFRRNLIKKNNIKFNETLIIKEDEIFTLEYCKHIKTIGISSLLPYNYRILRESVSHSRNRKRNMLQLAHAIESHTSAIPGNSKLKRILVNANSGYYFEAIKENLFKDEVDQIINQYIYFNNQHYKIINLSLKRRLLLYIPIKSLRNTIIKKYLRLLYYEN